MRLFVITGFFAGVLCVATSVSEAQPGKKGGKSETVEAFVAKVMAFNTAKDGKLTKTELTDKRLLALFERADANKDGVVTRAELEALFQKEKLEGGGFGGKGDKGPGGKGDKGGFGDKKGGFGDKKGKGFPQPGVVLSPFVQDLLKLSDEQRQKIADLQKDVDAKLDKILTPEQRDQMKQFGKGFGPGGDKKDKKGPGGDKKKDPDRDR
jgi:hypothetical protein